MIMIGMAAIAAMATGTKAADSVADTDLAATAAVNPATVGSSEWPTSRNGRLAILFGRNRYGEPVLYSPGVHLAGIERTNGISDSGNEPVLRVGIDFQTE